MPPPKNSIKGLPAGAEVRPLQVEGLPEGAEIRPIGDSGGSSPSGSGTGGTPPATQAPQQGGFLNTLGREVGSLYDSVVGLPKAAYHAFTDDPTLDERMRYEPEMNGARLDDNSLRHKVGLGLARMTSQPVDIADEAYRNHRVGYEDALSVAPEALGAGAGGVVGGKLLSKVIPSRAPVNPNETLKMPMAPGLAEKAAAVRSAIPRPTTGGAVFHPVASGAELATRGLLSKVSEIAGRTPPDPNLMSITDEIRPSRPQPITAEQAAIDAAREGETGTVHQGGPPMEQAPPPGGPRQSLADRVGIQAGRPEPNIQVTNPPEPARMFHGGTKPTGPVQYFTPDRSMAESYVDMHNDRFGPGGSIHEKSINLKNPVPEDVLSREAQTTGIDNEHYTPASVFDENLHGPAATSLATKLKSAGYDGAVLDDIAYGKQISGKAHVLFGDEPPQPAAPSKRISLADQIGITAGRPESNIQTVNPPEPTGPRAVAPKPNLMSQVVRGQEEMQPGSFTERRMSPERRGMFETSISELRNKLAGSTPEDTAQLNTEIERLRTMAREGGAPPTGGPLAAKVAEDTQADNMRLESNRADTMDDSGLTQELGQQLERGQAEEQSRSFFRNNKPDVSKTTQSTYAEENPAPKRESPMKAPWGGKFGRSKK